MRLILNTNVLIAALIAQGTPPDRLYKAWRDGRLTLVTSERQLEVRISVHRDRPFRHRDRRILERDRPFR